MTRREQVLAAVASALASGLAPARLVRNQALPEFLPPAGFVNLADGDPGEPEVTLSPPNYLYQHRASIELVADDPAGLDALIASIGAALSDPSLGGVVDWLEPSAPRVDSFAAEGGAALAGATIDLTLVYATDHPLR